MVSGLLTTCTREPFVLTRACAYHSSGRPAGARRC